MKLLRQYGLYLAWLIAVLSLLVTLLLGEVLHYPICHLCWYQRICLYPLTIILGIAAYNDDRHIIRYAAPLLIIGLLFATYQYLLQILPGFAPIGLCGSGPSCSDTSLMLAGFITLPLASVIACLGMLLLLLVARQRDISK